MLQRYVLGVQFCGGLRQLVLLQRQQFYAAQTLVEMTCASPQI